MPNQKHCLKNKRCCKTYGKKIDNIMQMFVRVFVCLWLNHALMADPIWIKLGTFYPGTMQVKRADAITHLKYNIITPKCNIQSSVIVRSFYIFNSTKHY